MKHHTSILLFLVCFGLILALISKPVKHVYAATVTNQNISASQLDSLQQCTGIVIPATVATTITTTESFTKYIIATFGSFFMVIIMALLKFFFPKIFGTVPV
jgi:cytochrome bd-type quinol oxidase subunit 2